MEEQERKLAEFRAEQEAVKKRAADRHAEEKGLREQQVKRLQVGDGLVSPPICRIPAIEGR